MSERRFWGNYLLRLLIVLLWTAAAGLAYGPWFAAIVAALVATVVSSHAGRFKEVAASWENQSEVSGRMGS